SVSFFFSSRRRHTRFSRDWSSDVCSSDLSFQTDNSLTLPISAPGSAGMEAAFANVLEPGDKVVVCVNGVFGQRMAANVMRMGGEIGRASCRERGGGAGGGRASRNETRDQE